MATKTRRTVDNAWFGPRDHGWGWTPASWQGWLVTLAGLIVIVLAQLLGGVIAGIATFAVGAALILIALRFGTPPGRNRNRD